MPTSSIGECVPEVTSPPPAIGMPWRGTAFSSITKAASFWAGPSSLIRRSSATPLNSLSSAHVQPRPAEIASVSVGDVIAVQRITHLEPERVARAEAARRRPVRDDRIPELDCILGDAHQLDARLTRVAGAADHHLDAVDLAHRVRERGSVGSPRAAIAVGPGTETTLNEPAASRLLALFPRTYLSDAQLRRRRGNLAMI